MTTERRRAPRRTITKIDRSGSWGKVTYRHHLSCGHIEERKRAASTKELACTWCPKAEEKQKEIRALSKIVYFDDGISLADQEIKIEKARASISVQLGVPLDAVDIAVEDITGTLTVKGATIYLSARDVERITRGG